MANDRRDTVLLQYVTDKRALKASQKAARDIQKDIDKLAAVVKALGQTEGDAVDELARLTAELNRQEVANEKAAQGVRGLANDLREIDQASQRAASSAYDYGDAYRAASDQVEHFGDAASNIRSISGAIGFLGGDIGAGVERVINVGAEIMDAREGITRLVPALQAMRGGAAATEAASTAAGVASTGASVSLGTLAGAAAMVAAPVIAIVAILGHFRSEAARVGEQTRVLIGAQQEAIEFARHATEEELEDRLSARRAEIDAANEEIARLDVIAQDAERQLAAMNLGWFTGAAQAIFGGGASSIDELTAAIDKQRDIVLAAETEIDALGSTRAQELAAANSAAEAEERLAEKRAEATEAAEQAAAAERQLAAQSAAARVAIEMETAQRLEDMTTEQAEARLSQIEIERTAIMGAIAELQALDTDEARAEIETLAQRMNALSEESSTLNQTVMPAIAAREAEVQAVQSQIDAENELVTARQRVAQEAQAIAKITERGATERAKIEAEVADGVADITSQIEAAWAELPGALAAIDSEYMAASTARATKFHKQEARLDEDANAKRLQRIRALQESLLQAEEDNDVVAFIRAQRAGERQLSEMDANASKAQRRRSEDFIAEQEARRVERAARIVEVQAGIAERMAALENERKELTDGLKARLDKVTDAAQKEIKALQAANAEKLRQQQEADARRLDQQRRLDEALARSAITAHQQAMDAVQSMGTSMAAQMRSLASQARGTGGVPTSSMAARLARLQAQGGAGRRGGRGLAGGQGYAAQMKAARGQSLTSAMSSSLLRSLSGYGLPTRGFAFGGVVTSPTIGLLGERPGYKDIVHSVPMGGGMGTNVTINLGNIGGDVSRAEVHNLLNDVGRQVVGAVRQARTGGR